jgi:hypothetical protein
MRIACFALALLLSIVAPAIMGPNNQHPVPPGIREADKQTNAPLEAPLPPRAKPRDPAQLQSEAAELAQLSAGIPAQIQRVNQGQLPKDLNDQLKRIEKLSKHLRSEVTP